MKKPTRQELKNQIPYVIVVGESPVDVAVYSRDYHLVRENFRWNYHIYLFAHDMPKTQEEFGFKFTSPDQQPSWMTDERKRSHCHVYFMYDDSYTDQQLMALRDRWFGVIGVNKSWNKE
jgi:hypothetical protein